MAPVHYSGITLVFIGVVGEVYAEWEMCIRDRVCVGFCHFIS